MNFRKSYAVNLPLEHKLNKKQLKYHLALLQPLLYATYLLSLLWKEKLQISWNFCTNDETMYCKILTNLVPNRKVTVSFSNYYSLEIFLKYKYQAATSISIFSMLLFWKYIYCIHLCPPFLLTSIISKNFNWSHSPFCCFNRCFVFTPPCSTVHTPLISSWAQTVTFNVNWI